MCLPEDFVTHLIYFSLKTERDCEVLKQGALLNLSKQKYRPSMMSQGKTTRKDPWGVFPASEGSFQVKVA